jgi:hypothetical protein
LDVRGMNHLRLGALLASLSACSVAGSTPEDADDRDETPVSSSTDPSAETGGTTSAAPPAAPPPTEWSAAPAVDSIDPPVAVTPPSSTVGPRCDPKKPFGAAKPATGVNATVSTSHARLSSDELNVFFTRAGATTNDIFVAARADRTAPWGAATLVTVSSPTAHDGAASMTADGLTMFFHSNRTTAADYDVLVSRRKSLVDSWGAPARITAITTTSRETDPSVRADGRMLVFTSNRVVGTVAANYDLYRAYIDETGAVGAPSRIAELTSAADETNPTMTADGLAIYFARRGVSQDIFVARRAAVNLPFGAPARVEELTTPADERPGWISPDECVLWFSAVRTGSVTELYVAERPL